MGYFWTRFVRHVAVEVSKICPRCVCAEYPKIVRSMERMENNQNLMYDAYLRKSRSGTLLQIMAVACSCASLGFVAHDHLVDKRDYEEGEENIRRAVLSGSAGAASGAAAAAAASGAN